MEFFSEWARLRWLDGPLTVSQLEYLETLASTSAEHILIATIQIEGGRRYDDEALLSAGLQRFCAGLHDEQLDVIISLPDVAILGSAARRRELLDDVWQAELGASNPALMLLRDPRPDTARMLLAKGFQDLEDLPAVLHQEIRRQISWRALDAFVERRDPVWLELLKTPEVQLSGREAGQWEANFIGTLVLLAQGYVTDAVDSIGRLSSRVPTGWRRQYLQRTCTEYSYLAAPRIADWMAAVPGPAMSLAAATSPHQEIGAFMAQAAVGDFTERSLDLILQHLAKRPSATFLAFLQFAGDELGGCFAGLLRQHLAGAPTEFERLPWANRHGAFARACGALSAEQGLPLLAAASRVTGSQPLRTQLVAALRDAPAAALDLVPSEILSDLLMTHRDALSPATGMALDRGLVFRAVIDASNLVLVGSHSNQRVGQLRYYLEAVAHLREAGFREILTYFDASIRHKMPPKDWAAIETLEVARAAMIVRGAADPHIIREFLNSPERTWIVTGDDYRDHLVEFPELGQYWFKHRLHFHVDHRDCVVWDRSLTSAELPPGAPLRPWRNV